MAGARPSPAHPCLALREARGGQGKRSVNPSLGQTKAPLSRGKVRLLNNWSRKAPIMSFWIRLVF